MMRYQGRQSRKIDLTDLIKSLDEYFDSYSFPVSEIIKNMEFNYDGLSKGKTSVSKMIKALEELKRPDLYEDVNLICHEYWGWKLPDISDLHEKILDDYRKTQKVYVSLLKSEKAV